MLSLNLLLPGWNTACLDSDAISNHSQRRFKSSVKSGLMARLQHEFPSRVFEEQENRESEEQHSETDEEKQ